MIIKFIVYNILPLCLFKLVDMQPHTIVQVTLSSTLAPVISCFPGQKFVSDLDLKLTFFSSYKHVLDETSSIVSC